MRGENGAAGVTWNLEELVSPPGEAGVEAALAEADGRLEELSAAYRGKIADLSARRMRELLTEYEAILDLAGRAESYASLSWTTQTDDAARGALLQKVTERGAVLAQKGVFLDIEWANAPEEAAASLIADPLLSPWRHWLIISRRNKPHLLSEPEEKILAEKSVTGRQAWGRFFDETLASTLFEWEGAMVPEEVILRKLHDPERAVRRQAAGSLTRGLRGTLRMAAFVTNTLAADKASDDRLRRYPTWISSRNRDNQVDDATVEALVHAVTSRYDIVARYYRLKKRLLGLEELFDYDRYAPLQDVERSLSWGEARETVLGAYSRFHPRMAEIAAHFFEKRWIDAAVHPGKRGGAFSSSTVPSAHPYVLLNFQGTAQDVMTLAHELGHGVHQYLARERGVLQQNTPLTTAETASLFGETLVFQDLLSRENDPRAALSMIVRQVESSFATVFRQVAMNRFEEAVHTLRRTEGEIPAEVISRKWRETQEAMFGGSVTLTGDYDIWWSYIPHFLHAPGYVYAYAFGDLLVRALYARFQEAGPGFPALYLDMLSAGGSDWPTAIVKPLGVDLADPGFWARGIGLLEAMVAEAEHRADALAGEPAPRLLNG
jgi:oligoendopeptidase F